MPKHIRHQRAESADTPSESEVYCSVKTYAGLTPEEEDAFMTKLKYYWCRVKTSIMGIPKEGYRADAPKEEKNTMRNVLVALLLLMLIAAVAHYMGYITLPGAIADMIPRKAAPASHLQYFFF